MFYRCHDCDGLFESPHTNYKYAKGFHPKDNPTHSAEIAGELDHCPNCQARKTYDPVAARKLDLLNASAGPASSVVLDLQSQVATLSAQIEAAKNEKAVASDLAAQVASLRDSLASLKAAPAQAGA